MKLSRNEARPEGATRWDTSWRDGYRKREKERAEDPHRQAMVLNAIQGVNRPISRTEIHERYLVPNGFGAKDRSLTLILNHLVNTGQVCRDNKGKYYVRHQEALRAERKLNEEGLRKLERSMERW